MPPFLKAVLYVGVARSPSDLTYSTIQPLDPGSDIVAVCFGQSTTKAPIRKVKGRK